MPATLQAQAALSYFTTRRAMLMPSFDTSAVTGKDAITTVISLSYGIAGIGACRSAWLIHSENGRSYCDVLDFGCQSGTMGWWQN